MICVRTVRPARPIDETHVPEQKCVDVFETVRTHLGLVNSKASAVDVKVTLPVFGFCVDVTVHGKDLQDVLELLKARDHESIAQHPSVGECFKAEAARLGIHLRDVLPFLEAGVLDEFGRLPYHVYPGGGPDYVDPTEIVRDVCVVFTVGHHGLPQSTHDVPSPTDLCKAAMNPRLYNEHRRLALEALAIQAAAQDSTFCRNAKKGLTTLGCLLSTHSDASVREQAQELLVAAMTSESLTFIGNFFKRLRHPLGDRIVQEITQLSATL